MGHASSSKSVIASRMAEALPVQKHILDAVEARDYPKEAVFAVRLALDEAIANAIKHGNGSDPDKTVTITYDLDDVRVEITICDQGPGFAPNELEDPTSDENLARPHGRGVMLMRAYMTEVRFNRSGNCVTMVKRRRCPLPRGA